MKKPSMMGSSKYEFNPEQFDIDVIASKERYKAKYERIESELKKIVFSDNERIEETWNIVIKVLRDLKEEYGHWIKITYN